MRPVSVTTWGVSTKTLNMSWSPDIVTNFRDNVEFLYKNTEYQVSPDIESSLRENMEFLHKNTEYELVSRY